MTGILTNALGFYSSYCLLVFLEFLGVAAGYSFSLFLILHLSEVPLKYKIVRRRAMRCCAGLGPVGPLTADASCPFPAVAHLLSLTQSFFRAHKKIKPEMKQPMASVAQPPWLLSIEMYCTS